MHYLLRNRDSRAARQLIFIGEQNNVRELLDMPDRQAYDKLVSRYRGPDVTRHPQDYLENYRNIASLPGKNLSNMGIEIFLDDLAKPSRSIVSAAGPARTA